MTWLELAACRGRDPSLWFPAKGDQMSLEVARAVCRSCPVRSECLDAALVEEAELGPLEAHGVRGGLTAPQRAGLVVARRSGPAVSRPEADSAIGEPAPARAAL